MSPFLPAVETCTWLEAEETAEVLEALAAELYIGAGNRPEGWRNRKRHQRWLGQHQVVNRIRYRSMRYRQRQLELREQG